MRAHRPPHLLGQLLSSGIRVSFAVVLESKGLHSGSTSELLWTRDNVSEPVSSSIKGNNNHFT